MLSPRDCCVGTGLHSEWIDGSTLKVATCYVCATGDVSSEPYVRVEKDGQSAYPCQDPPVISVQPCRCGCVHGPWGRPTTTASLPIAMCSTWQCTALFVAVCMYAARGDHLQMRYRLSKSNVQCVVDVQAARSCDPRRRLPSLLMGECWPPASARSVPVRATRVVIPTYLPTHCTHCDPPTSRSSNCGTHLQPS